MTKMTKERAFKEINETQDYYINELIDVINAENHACFKTVDFTSATGTGKTMMMAKLMNSLPNIYFIITTLSKGQLHIQIKNNLKKYVNQDNYVVYGSCDYKKGSKLTADDIINNIPEGKQCIWLRDEGHIKTNKFDELLMNRCFKVVNFSATNMKTDVKCNFTNTMMLRTVHQTSGTIDDAILKLLEVKKIHKNVPNYNPCAIFRLIDSRTQLDRLIEICNTWGLKYINITDETFDMFDLCQDDNEYDVIINKFKIVEGIDIRRAHVLYMDNKPSNAATTIQVIGRCRRNALLYRDDIDIFTKKNVTLLKETMKCYVYYNVADMKIDTDENGELEYAFCDTVSVQQLKTGSIISVEDGKMANGLTILELEGQTGDYQVLVDEETGFNIIKPEGAFYDSATMEKSDENSLVFVDDNHSFWAYKLSDLKQLPKKHVEFSDFNYVTGEHITRSEYVVDLHDTISTVENYTINVPVVNYIITHLDEAMINKYSNMFNEEERISFLIALSKCADGKSARYILKKGHEYEPEPDLFKDYESRNFTSPILTLKNIFAKNKSFSFEVLSYHRPKEHTDRLHFKFLKCMPEVLEKRYIRVCDLPQIFKSYTLLVNDRHSAIVGPEDMKQVKNYATGKPVWVENKTVTTKVKKYCKFNTYIQEHYKEKLAEAENNCFAGKNVFKFDSKCNACLGYCVEYYSKYLVYGEGFLSNFLYAARSEANYWKEMTDNLIVRACMLKYKATIRAAYGEYAAKLVRTISVQKLISEQYTDFVATVVELGTKTANFVRQTLYTNKEPLNNIDPNLTIRHIAGLADYITEDTILDVKTTNRIESSMLRQVLAYHYLSTKRSDLHIKRVIVYDAVSGKNVTIEL